MGKTRFCRYPFNFFKNKKDGEKMQYAVNLNYDVNLRYIVLKLLHDYFHSVQCIGSNHHYFVIYNKCEIT